MKQTNRKKKKTLEVKETLKVKEVNKTYKAQKGAENCTITISLSKLIKILTVGQELFMSATDGGSMGPPKSVRIKVLDR